MKRSGLNRKGGGPLKRNKPLQGKSTLSGSSALKREGKLESKTPLKSGSKLESKTPLNRGKSVLKSEKTLSRGSGKLSSSSGLSGKSKISSKIKPPSPEELACREVVEARSGGVCEICGKRVATDMAHRLAVSQSGLWQPSNLLHACRWCHSYNHDHPQNSFDHGWHIRSGFSPLEMPVLLAKEDGTKSWFFLEDDGGKRPKK